MTSFSMTSLDAQWPRYVQPIHSNVNEITDEVSLETYKSNTHQPNLSCCWNAYI